MSDNSPWGNGPWGGKNTPGGKEPADSDGQNGPGGDGQRSEGPRNPWTTPAGGQRSGSRGPMLDDLLRRGGGGKFPFDVQGRTIWPWAVGGLLLLWLAMTSIHRLGPEQQGVVTLFGSYARTVGPGISLTLPAPIETLSKVDTQQIRTTEVGGSDPNQENLVLTSDQNIIDMAYEVRWSISNPTQYLFQLDDPEATVQEVSESAMRAAVASFRLSDAIGPGRSDIEAQVRERMQRILDGYRSGIQVQGVAIRESDPPVEVVEAFKNVNAAKQRKESYLNDARAYAQQVTERAKGDTAAFDQVYAQYRLAPDVTKRRMYYETMEAVLGKVDKTIVESGNVTSYLPLPEIKRRSQAADASTNAAPARATAQQAGQ